MRTLTPRVDGARLPDFIVIGAMRAGTTTLHEILATHPEITMSRQKEPDFFIQERNWKRGIDWYAAQFRPPAPRYGEVSPNYTKAGKHPGVPSRIAEMLPQCRFIFMARDPVERALSGYAYNWLMGWPLRPEEIKASKDVSGLIDASLYHRQITQYLPFFPLESILVLDFEAFVRDPRPALSEIADFIGVSDTWDLPESPRNSRDSLKHLPEWFIKLRKSRIVDDLREFVPNFMISPAKAVISSRKKREVPKLDSEIRDLIADAVADDAAAFRRLTGRSFPHWSV